MTAESIEFIGHIPLEAAQGAARRLSELARKAERSPVEFEQEVVWHLQTRTWETINESWTFRDFVQAKVADGGLSMDLEHFERLAKSYIANPAVLDALDRLQQRKPGNPNRDPETGKLVGPSVDDVNERAERPTGNSRANAIRRLRKEAETSDRARELRDRVLAGELSPHAAAVEMGWRKRPDPVEQVRKWWAKLTPEQRDSLWQELAEGVGR